MSLNQNKHGLQKGTILYDAKFQFYNGGEAKKLLVLLNTPDLAKNEPYLVCKTTSNPKNKGRTPGCQYTQSLFFIEAGKDWFKYDTWLQLYEIYEFSARGFLQRKFKGYLEIKGKLKKRTIEEIKNCVTKLVDVSQYHQDLVKKDC